MNIIQALEANKTNSVRVKLPNRGWIKVGGLLQDYVFDKNEIQAEWEAEPEKIQFECTLLAELKNECGYMIAKPHVYNSMEKIDWNFLNNKAVKITIEVPL